MGSFTKWLSETFGKETAKQIENDEYAGNTGEALELEKLAIQTAVGLIASAVAQCDFRTFLGGEEIRGDEYYAWNYSPNKNQNSTQFLQQLLETWIYNNEALIVEKDGQFFVADFYYEVIDGAREHVFEGISVGGEVLPDKRAGEVIFLKMHNESIRPLLSNVCHQYEKLMTKASDSYQRSSADKGILNIDSRAKGKLGDDEKIRNDLLENRFKKFFGAGNAVLPLHEGYTYTPHTKSVRNTSELSDIKNMSDEIYNRVGQAFRIPPSMLRGETANASGNTENFMKFGVRPFCNELQEEITRKRYGLERVKEGSYMMVDSSGVEVGSVFEAATKIDKLISCGVYSIDEIRAKIGETELGTEAAQNHYITKNYEKIGGK